MSEKKEQKYNKISLELFNGRNFTVSLTGGEAYQVYGWVIGATEEKWYEFPLWEEGIQIINRNNVAAITFERNPN